MPFDDVEVIHGDTAFAPYGLGTYGSRSVAVGGTAVHLAASKVRDKARLVAAQMLEASPDDLDFEGGAFAVKGSPDKRVDDPGGGVPRLAGVRHARGRDARAGRDGLLRPAELRVPVRRARMRGRGRSRDREGRDHGLHRRGRLRQRDQPDDRRWTGARRRRARDRPGALRGRRVRRGRPARHRNAGRLPDPVGGRRPAASRRTAP